MMINIPLGTIYGLDEREEELFRQLYQVYIEHASANSTKERYYEGKISLSEVNLGIALPNGMAGLEVGCAWGAKAVDVLASRSMFDGFVGMNGTSDNQLELVVAENRLIAEYMKACRDELKFGTTFATMSAGGASGCKIRFHSPQTAAALWDGEKGRISCGFAVIDTAPSNNSSAWTPSRLNLYTDDAIWVLSREPYRTDWTAERHAHRMGRPLMEPLTWNATSTKPFGQSRLKAPVRRLIQGYVRTVANASIALEFSTAPQKYILGVTEEQFDKITSNKFNQYVGSILATTYNPESGDTPKYGQLTQGTISPHIEMLRLLATQFSAATGLSTVDTGVVNEANPTSSDAILAQTNFLVSLAEQLNAGNGDALRTIAQMALAIANATTMEALSEEQRSNVAHFRNPAMPSIAATADAAIKVASARNDFASTDVFAEMIGFDQADIRRIKAQERRVRGLRVLEELEAQSPAGAAGSGTEDQPAEG